jgi:peptidoglycan/xylan/chitin deacetylase (PgdA/CDA1 family)
VIDSHLEFSAKAEKPYALITFDDGFSSYFRNAVPILNELKCPSLIFLNMGPILEGQIFWSGLVNYLQHSDKEFPDFVRSFYPKINIFSGGEFLYCTENILDEFLRNKDRDVVFERAKMFYGVMATKKDLVDVSNDPLVSFGNHLFNHYNADLLNDEELEIQYMKNDRALKEFKGHTSLFSYPYGVPNMCFSDRTDQLILKLGARGIFSAYSRANKMPIKQFFNRFSLPSDVVSEHSIESYLIKMFLYDRIKVLSKDKFVGYQV